MAAAPAPAAVGLLLQKLACKTIFAARPGSGTRPGAVCARIEVALYASRYAISGMSSATQADSTAVPSPVRLHRGREPPAARQRRQDQPTATRLSFCTSATAPFPFFQTNT